MTVSRLTTFVAALSGLLPLNRGLMSAALAGESSSKAPAGWSSAAPREEIRPHFAYEASGGRSGQGALIIQHDGREGLDGYWTRKFPVTGGRFYRFEAFRRSDRVTLPRRSALVRLLWQDEKGNKVIQDALSSASSRYETNVLRGFTRWAEAEHPLDKATDAAGWTEVSDVYRAPLTATRATVELHLQWAPHGKIEWSDVSMKETGTPTGRKVRLAAVHFRPQAGKTPAEKKRNLAFLWLRSSISPSG